MFDSYRKVRNELNDKDYFVSVCILRNVYDVNFHPSIISLGTGHDVVFFLLSGPLKVSSSYNYMYTNKSSNKITYRQFGFLKVFR